MGFLKKKHVVAFAGLTLGSSMASAADWYLGVGAGNASIDHGAFSVDEATEQLFGEDLDVVLSDLDSIPGVNAAYVLDDSDTGYKLFGGFNLNDSIAFELGYTDLGEMRNEFYIDDAIEGRVFSLNETYGVSGVYGAAVGRLPLSELVSLNGRVGIYMWDVDADASLTDTLDLFGGNQDIAESDDGDDAFYGVGLDIGWFGIFYEKYDVDGYDVEFGGISISAGF